MNVLWLAMLGMACWCSVCGAQPGVAARPSLPAQPGKPAPAVAPPAPAATPEEPLFTPVPLKVRYADRLAALRPSNPEGYYLLGEEAADAAFDATGRQLAVELFVLAVHLDLQQQGIHATAAAACIGLASLTPSTRDQRWLVFMARTLDARRSPPPWLAQQAPETQESAGYQIATMLGYVRSGDGVPARHLLDNPEVRSAFESYDSMLSYLGGGNVNTILRQAQRWPCPECGNERAVRRPGNPPEYRECPICHGDPGPEMSEREFLGQLTFEALLLQGTQRSWAAQIATDGGEPLRDADPAAIAQAYSMDTRQVLWRDGRWVVDPNAKPPAPPAAEGVKPDPGEPAVPAKPENSSS